MRGLQETLKTIAVVATLWGIVALIAYVGGAIPSSLERSETTDVGDAGVETADADVTSNDAPSMEQDAPTEVEEETLALRRQTLCQAPPNVTWATARLLVEDGPDIFAVACADGVQLVGRLDDTFVRFASFRVPEGNTVNDIALGDVDGDRAVDLVIATSDGLYFVPRREDGSFDEPRVLAPSRHGALVLAALDSTPGLEIAVVHGEGARPEVWIFHGGLTPLRSTAFAAPISPSSIQAADLDLDGHIDLVVTGATQTTLAFGDSRGGMPRTRSLATGGTRASHAHAGAIVVERDGAPACTLQPSPAMADAGDCVPQEHLADGLRDLAVASSQRDSDASGEVVDVVATLAWNQPALVSTADNGATWTDRLRLATRAFGVHRYLDYGGEVLLLGSTADANDYRQLELAIVHPGDVRRLSDGEAEPLREAPLVTHSILPDPNTPR